MLTKIKGGLYLIGGVLTLLGVTWVSYWELTTSPLPTLGEYRELNSSPYIVNTPACNIPDLDPWDPTIVKYIYKNPVPQCPVTPTLTYQDDDKIYINTNVYRNISGFKNIKCQYEEIIRKKGDDNSVSFGKAVDIDMMTGFTMKTEFVRVSCYISHQLMYRNFHASIPESKVKGKSGDPVWRDDGKTWNVLLVGTDTVSRSASLRYMPKTRRYLMENLKAFDFRGHTKVGLNTFPNMVPFLTGFHENEIVKKKNKQLDYLPLLFKEYSKAGYATYFAEDCSYMGTFNYLRPGFHDPITDYYLRPAMKVIERDKGMKFKGCEKKLAVTKFLMKYLRDFLQKFVNKKFFALSFSVGLSHDSQEDMRYLDNIYPELFHVLESFGVWDNTILLFFGDHGARWGSIGRTTIGQDEDRLPMFYLAFPEKFRAKYPEHLRNIKINTHRLTTPFDIHRTLEDILNFTGEIPAQNESARGQSLFAEITTKRTCEAAGIELQYCVCHRRMSLSVNDPIAVMAAKFLVGKVNHILKDIQDVCFYLNLEKIHSVSKRHGFAGLPSDLVELDYYQVTFSTLPGKALFQGTVTAKTEKKGYFSDLGPTFNLMGNMARKNKYGNTSDCVKLPAHRIYCYCRTNLH